MHLVYSAGEQTTIFSTSACSCLPHRSILPSKRARPGRACLPPRRLPQRQNFQTPQRIGSIDRPMIQAQRPQSVSARSPVTYAISLNLICVEIADVPATYFEATTADIKAVQNSLHARTEALVNAPFRTREMREAAEKIKAEKYPTVSRPLPER